MYMISITDSFKHLLIQNIAKITNPNEIQTNPVKLKQSGP